MLRTGLFQCLVRERGEHQARQLPVTAPRQAVGQFAAAGDQGLHVKQAAGDQRRDCMSGARVRSRTLISTSSPA